MYKTGDKYIEKGVSVVKTVKSLSVSLILNLT